MSLEEQIKELNGNIVKLIDVMAKRGPGRPPKDDAKKGDSKGADKKADKAPTEEELREVFGTFMRVDDEDERESRKTFVKGVLKEYKVAKATEIPEDERANAIKVIKDEQAKRDAKADDGDDDLV